MKRNSTRRIVALTMFVTCLLSAPAVRAQNGTVGTLSGGVMSSEGKGLPGATVTVTSARGPGQSVQTTTDVNGYFIVRGLPPGDYQVSIAAPAFKTIERTVEVSGGSSSTIDTLLQGDPIKDTVIVVSTQPTVRITPDAYDTLPLINRFPTTVVTTVSSSPATGPTSGQLYVQGGFPYANQILVDGASVADNLYGNANTFFIEDAVDEVQLFSQGISAEYGRFTGGVLNVVTKSGGNEFYGSLRGDFQDSALSGEVPEFGKPDRSDQVFEGTLGGRIIRDRLWFFAAGRGASENQRVSLEPLGPTITLNTEEKESDVRFSGKLLWTPRTSDRLSATLLGGNLSESGLPSFSRSATSDTLIDRDARSTLFVGSYNGLISSNLFLEAQYAQKKFGFQHNGGQSSNVIDSPFFTFGGLHVGNAVGNGNVDQQRDRDDISATLSYFLSTSSFGRHDIKGGVGRSKDTRSENPALSSTGIAIVTDFLKDSAGNYALDANGLTTPIWIPFDTTAIAFPNPNASMVELVTNSFFVNDAWRLNDRWSFNLGVRYDQAGVESEGNHVVDSGRIAPRLGFMYDIKGDGNWIFHATYGQYVALDVKTFSQGAFLDQAVYGVYIGPPDTGRDSINGFNPDAYILFFVSNPRQAVIVDPDTKLAVNGEVSIGTQYNLRRGSVSGQYVRRSYGDVFENFVPDGLAQVTLEGITSPADRQRVGNTDATRVYEAFDAALRLRPSEHFQFAASYTASRLYGTYSGITDTGTPATSIIGDYPPLLEPALHFPELALDGEEVANRARIWVTGQHPVGAGVFYGGLVARIDSGRTFRYQATIPFSAQQQQISGQQGYLDRPSTQTIFYGDTGRYESSKQLDVALTYEYPLTRGDLWVKAEIFNTGNSTAKRAFNTNVTPAGPANSLGIQTNYVRSANFGQARSASDYQQPRSFRFSVGFRF